MVDTKESLKKEIEVIAQNFLIKLEQSIFFFEEFIQSLEEGDFNRMQHNEVLNRIHKVAGSAEVFGFERLGDIASRIEDDLKGELTSESAYNIREDLKMFLQEARIIIDQGLKVRGDGSSKIVSDDVREVEGEERHNILIAEDNDLMRDLISKALRDEGCFTYEAKDGEEALKMSALLEKTLDLIILDVNMPKKDGFEVIKLLKSDEITRKIPVIMLTRRVSQEDIAQGIKDGAIDYIAKPFKIEDLVKRIIEALEDN
jgi:CheY-like chemotaxis protein/HPt (histidine-containing phosphotransfer) domain-containing protein